MPIAWAAGIAAVGSVVAGGEQASGQKAAANTQQNMFNTLTKQEQPFIQGGYGAETALNQLLGTSKGSFGGLPNGYLTQTFNPTQKDLENYPGYQWQKQQGQLAVESQNSATQSAIGGPALKSLMDFNQGLASSNYGTYFNQFNSQRDSIFNRLSQIAGMGQNAAGNLGTAGTQLGTGIAQAQAGAAASNAAGIVGATNAASSGLGLNYLMNNSNTYHGGSAGDSPYQAGTPYGSGANTGDYSNSDCGMKKNLAPIYFDGMSELQVYEFHYKTQDDSEPKHQGFIAQEVQKKYPNVVKRGPHGFLGVNYRKLWDSLAAKLEEFADYSGWEFLNQARDF